MCNQKEVLSETGGSMGKITQNKRMRNYHKIFEQIYENPVMTIYDISVNTGLSRNTVAKYVKEMYKQGVIQGPHIRMRHELY